MKTEIKTNVFIKGFDTEEAFRSMLYGTKSIELIYQGNTDGIPEELAIECVDWNEFDEGEKLYYNYSGNVFKYTAKESIQSAVTKTTGYVYPFIVIYKNKNS